MKTTFHLFVILFILTSCSGNSSKTEKPANDSLNSLSSTPIDTLILGIDVSHFQGKIDWEKIKAANIRFAYDKATQGSKYKDPDYDQNKIGAHSVGLLHGSYHFFVSNEPGLDQALHFCKTIDYGESDMPPVLDLEQQSIVGTEPVNKSDFQKEVVAWLREVEDQLGVKPIIYTNHPFGDAYLNDSIFADYELWIAEYGVSNPKVPKLWESKGWLIWQRSERGEIEGAIGNVDHDIFNPKKPFRLGIK